MGEICIKPFPFSGMKPQKIIKISLELEHFNKELEQAEFKFEILQRRLKKMKADCSLIIASVEEEPNAFMTVSSA